MRNQRKASDLLNEFYPSGSHYGLCLLEHPSTASFLLAQSLLLPGCWIKATNANASGALRKKNTRRLTVTYQPMATLSDGAWEVQKRPTSAHSISSISRPPSIFGRPAPSIWVNEIGRITFHPRQNVNLISRRIFCFWLSALRSNYHCVPSYFEFNSSWFHLKSTAVFHAD